MFKRITWYLIVTLSVIGGAALSIGFLQSLEVTGIEQSIAVNQENTAVSKTQKAVGKNTPTNQGSWNKKPNTIQIVVMGDSIARGTGDEQGRGFSSYLPEYLKNQTAKELAVENIAINGLKTDGLLEQLKAEQTEGSIKPQDPKGSSIGREDPQAVPQLGQLLASADLVLISIGGNDLRSLRRTEITTKQAEFDLLQQGYLDDLREIMKTIRTNNAKAVIVFMGVYNPYEKSDSAAEDNKLLSTWNYNTQQLIETDRGAIFIPTYDIFKLNTDRFVAVDGLHPNTMGYQLISQRIAKAIETLLK